MKHWQRGSKIDNDFHWPSKYGICFIAHTVRFKNIFTEISSRKGPIQIRNARDLLQQRSNAFTCHSKKLTNRHSDTDNVSRPGLEQKSITFSTHTTTIKLWHGRRMILCTWFALLSKPNRKSIRQISKNCANTEKTLPY